ncbi:MAG: hypothetical protein H7Z19_09890 [Chitinophagaceae bacterium]|nr:hypothetical protein [Rubrivivax sp.]
MSLDYQYAHIKSREIDALRGRDTCEWHHKDRPCGEPAITAVLTPDDLGADFVALPVCARCVAKIAKSVAMWHRPRLVPLSELLGAV